MKPIYKAWYCQIDITNVCKMNCLYCSRFTRHIRSDQKFFMSIEHFEQALNSLKWWPKQIGIIGGEPIRHPQFEEFCRLIQKKFRRRKMGLWTSGGPLWSRYKDIVDRTFGFVAFNQHTPAQLEQCRHQPATVAIKDVIKDEKLMWDLIDDCWVQRTWCPTINHKGGFFCEVAAALDTILDGPGGYDIKTKWWQKNWWRKKPCDFMDQVKRYCPNCGMSLPIERDLIKQKQEKMSPGNLALFKEHNLPALDKDHVIVFDQTLSKEDVEKNKRKWYPGNYRGDLKPDERASEGKGFTK